MSVVATTPSGTDSDAAGSTTTSRWISCSSIRSAASRRRRAGLDRDRRVHELCDRDARPRRAPTSVSRSVPVTTPSGLPVRGDDDERARRAAPSSRAPPGARSRRHGRRRARATSRRRRCRGRGVPCPRCRTRSEVASTPTGRSSRVATRRASRSSRRRRAAASGDRRVGVDRHRRRRHQLAGRHRSHRREALLRRSRATRPRAGRCRRRRPRMRPLSSRTTTPWMRRSASSAATSPRLASPRQETTGDDMRSATRVMRLRRNASPRPPAPARSRRARRPGRARRPCARG